MFQMQQAKLGLLSHLTWWSFSSGVGCNTWAAWVEVKNSEGKVDNQYDNLINMDNYEELVDSNPAVCDLFQSPDRPFPGFSVFICFLCCDYWPTANSNVTASIQFFLNLKKFHQGPVWGSRHICHCCAVAGMWGRTASDFHIKDFFETGSSIYPFLGKPSEKRTQFLLGNAKIVGPN